MRSLEWVLIQMTGILLKGEMWAQTHACHMQMKAGIGERHLPPEEQQPTRSQKRGVEKVFPPSSEGTGPFHVFISDFQPLEL